MQLSTNLHHDRRPQAGIHTRLQEVSGSLMRNVKVWLWLKYTENTQNKPTSRPNWHPHHGRNKGKYLWVSGSGSLRFIQIQGWMFVSWLLTSRFRSQPQPARRVRPTAGWSQFLFLQLSVSLSLSQIHTKYVDVLLCCDINTQSVFRIPIDRKSVV